MFYTATLCYCSINMFIQNVLTNYKSMYCFKKYLLTLIMKFAIDPKYIYLLILLDFSLTVTAAT